jgi:hypothetical protein
MHYSAVAGGTGTGHPLDIFQGFGTGFHGSNDLTFGYIVAVTDEFIVFQKNPP